MKITHFDPARELIWIDAQIWGPRGLKPLKLVVDTGAAMTLVIPDVLDDLGYSPRDGESRTTVTASIGKEPGYTIRVQQFSALGFRCSSFLVHAFDLADAAGLDGLIGLDYLKQFNYEVRSAEGRILVERV